MKKSKWYPLFLAIVLGFIAPTIFLAMNLYSCPHPSGLAYFPFASAECPGEFIGTLGLFIMGLPGIIVGVSFTFLAYTLLQNGNSIPIFDQLSGEAQLLFTVILSAITNVFVFWLAIKDVVANSKRVDDSNKERDKFNPEGMK